MIVAISTNTARIDVLSMEHIPRQSQLCHPSGGHSHFDIPYDVSPATVVCMSLHDNTMPSLQSTDPAIFSAVQRPSDVVPHELGRAPIVPQGLAVQHDVAVGLANAPALNQVQQPKPGYAIYP